MERKYGKFSVLVYYTSIFNDILKFWLNVSQLLRLDHGIWYLNDKNYNILSYVSPE